MSQSYFSKPCWHLVKRKITLCPRMVADVISSLDARRVLVSVHCFLFNDLQLLHFMPEPTAFEIPVTSEDPKKKKEDEKDASEGPSKPKANAKDEKDESEELVRHLAGAIRVCLYLLLSVYSQRKTRS